MRLRGQIGGGWLHALAVTRLGREYRRFLAVLLVGEGQSLSESARSVRVARSSVQRWVRQYLADRVRRASLPIAGWRRCCDAIHADWAIAN